MKNLSLQNRMRFALCGLATLVACLNLSFLWGVSKWAEDYIFEVLLKKEVENAHEAINANHQPKSHTAFFHFFADIEQVPLEYREWVSGLGPGIHEADERIYDYSAFAAVEESEAMGRFYIIGDVSDAEYMESHGDQVLKFAILSLGLSIMAAYLISGYMSAKAINPLRKLAEKIQSSEPDSSIKGFADGLTEDEIGVLARSFEDAHESIASYAERERRFTGDVSHELRTPLMAASNAVQIAAQDAKGGAMPQAKHFERAMRNLDKMGQLVRTFLALAREENRQQPLEEIVLKPLILDSVESFRQYFPHKELSFDIDCDDYARVKGRRQLAEIMISNIIGNAIQYASGGNIGIKVSGENDKLSLAVANDFPDASSLDFAALQKRFERGEQMSKSEGFGLGLSIVQRAGEALGWSCQLTSSTANRIVAIVYMYPKE